MLTSSSLLRQEGSMYLLFCFKRKIGTKVAPKAFGEHVLYYLFLVLKPFLKVRFFLSFTFYFTRKNFNSNKYFFHFCIKLLKVLKKKRKSFRKMFNSLCQIADTEGPTLLRHSHCSTHNVFPVFLTSALPLKQRGKTGFKRIWREIDFKAMNGKKISSVQFGVMRS